MDNEIPFSTSAKDPVTELYDVASALRFLEDAFEGHDESGVQIRASGAAYVAGLMSKRVNAIACTLWSMESPSGTSPTIVETRDIIDPE
ncbi:uncharacterized protein DFE_2039 [Desulfovibrio ferrophilus]|uniref:Uncharacterized protein n=1 Tax=Desulfovibrio ferrophilus TaxID=241368 RepID=A0A2Z6B001_9BACT|nr:uncharacterized protein DFE_2039 [Desulfovibrio ferrophilus]